MLCFVKHTCVDFMNSEYKLLNFSSTQPNVKEDSKCHPPRVCPVLSFWEEVLFHRQYNLASIHCYCNIWKELL